MLFRLFFGDADSRFTEKNFKLKAEIIQLNELSKVLKTS